MAASGATDVLGIYNSDGTQLFPLARPVKASIREECKPMEHPVEDGTVITDHRVIQPVEIEVPLVLSSSDYKSVYQAIRTAYLAADLLTVQTKVGSYGNMLIVKIPHEESADIFDGIQLAMSLKEVKIVTASVGKLPTSAVKHKRNASKQNRGQQSEKTAVAATSSPTTAQKAANWVKSLF